MVIRNKDVLGCLPMLASVLGRQYGVQVQIGGNRACTNGRVIMLPALPLDCDAELLATVRGFLDHEAAHIRHTDFACLNAADMDSVTFHLFNSIEDWRVENRLAAIYPGCRQNLLWLMRKHFAEDDAGAGSDDPAPAVLRYVLLTVRTWDAPEIEPHRAAKAAVIRQAFPGLLENLDAILARVRQKCEDTAASIGYARQLADCLKQWLPSKQKWTRPSPTDDSGQNGEDALTDSDTQKEQNDCTDSQAESVGESFPLNGENARQALSALFDLPASELPKQTGETLAAILEDSQKQSGKQGIEVAKIGHRLVLPLSDDEKQTALRCSNALRHRLHGLLQTRTQHRRATGRRGMLHTGSLYRMAVANPRVFQQMTSKTGMNTAIHILLDASGSMDGPRIVLARQACYAVARALEGIREINPAVTAFPALSSFNGVFPVVRHGEKATDRFPMRGAGGTPLAPALWWVMQTMLSLKENRKIILILTDGVPDDSPACVKAIRYAEQIGMEVLGIGIQHTAISSLLPESRVISELQELAPAMFGILQNALLKGGN